MADMGGPVVKATMSLKIQVRLQRLFPQVVLPAMAAVAGGGIVPPLAIFVATFFSKIEFTKEERNSG